MHPLIIPAAGAVTALGGYWYWKEKHPAFVGVPAGKSSTAIGQHAQVAAATQAPVSTPMSVSEAQAALAQLGIEPVLNVTGSMNSDTVKAIKAFQAKVNITVDGILGPQTSAALRTALGTAASTTGLRQPISVCVTQLLGAGQVPAGASTPRGTMNIASGSFAVGAPLTHGQFVVVAENTPIRFDSGAFGVGDGTSVWMVLACAGGECKLASAEGSLIAYAPSSAVTPWSLIATSGVFVGEGNPYGDNTGDLGGAGYDEGAMPGPDWGQALSTGWDPATGTYGGISYAADNYAQPMYAPDASQYAPGFDPSQYGYGPAYADGGDQGYGPASPYGPPDYSQDFGALSQQMAQQQQDLQYQMQMQQMQQQQAMQAQQMQAQQMAQQQAMQQQQMQQQMQAQMAAQAQAQAQQVQQARLAAAAADQHSRTQAAANARAQKAATQTAANTAAQQQRKQAAQQFRGAHPQQHG